MKVAYIAMAEELAISEVMNLLEAEPSSRPGGGIVADLAPPGPDIPALREQLAVLVLTGKAKEATGVQLSHEDVKCLSDKDVENLSKGTRLTWDQRKPTA